jgi:hypothetical protein
MTTNEAKRFTLAVKAHRPSVGGAAAAVTGCTVLCRAPATRQPQPESFSPAAPSPSVPLLDEAPPTAVATGMSLCDRGVDGGLVAPGVVEDDQDSVERPSGKPGRQGWWRPHRWCDVGWVHGWWLPGTSSEQ